MNQSIQSLRANHATKTNQKYLDPYTPVKRKISIKIKWKQENSES